MMNIDLFANESFLTGKQNVSKNLVQVCR